MIVREQAFSLDINSIKIEYYTNEEFCLEQRIYSSPKSQLYVQQTILSQSRIVIMSILILLCIVPFYIIYMEWGRNLIGWIASFFMEQGICSNTDDFAGCDKALRIYARFDKYGYIIYAVTGHISTSYIITIQMIKNRKFKLTEVLTLFYICTITLTASVYFGGGVKLSSAIYYLILISLGFIIGLFSLSRKQLANKIRRRK